jgi:hypothetical protein
MNQLFWHDKNNEWLICQIEEFKVVKYLYKLKIIINDFNHQTFLFIFQMTFVSKILIRFLVNLFKFISKHRIWNFSFEYLD